MHERCNKHTHPVWRHRGPPLGQQEGWIEQKQGPAQRYMDRDGVLHSVVSEEEAEGEQHIETYDKYTDTGKINAFW